MENANEVAPRADSAHSGNHAVFVLDARRSRFTVQAFATGILAAMGHNPIIGVRTFSGEVEFDPDALEAGKLRLIIQSSSLAVQDDISEKDRREIERMMKAEVLEIDKYPEIRFESSSISVTKIDGSLYSAVLNGSLSLHGVTRTELITARIVATDETLRASGDFTLNQSNYQIKAVSVAGGALKLKDELKFSFEMIARRREPAAS
jgi:polyisoprenoid-binding protein YceI